MKKFNVTGVCVPEKDYMVDIQQKLKQIMALIEDRQYFTINRAHQYGKTTTLAALYRQLKNQYTVIRMSFEGVVEETFSSSYSFVRFFVKRAGDFLEFIGEPAELISEWRVFEEEEFQVDTFECLSRKISALCKKS